MEAIINEKMKGSVLWEAMTPKERAREFLKLVKIEYDEMKSRNLVPKKMSKELQAAIIDGANDYWIEYNYKLPTGYDQWHDLPDGEVAFWTSIYYSKCG